MANDNAFDGIETSADAAVRFDAALVRVVRGLVFAGAVLGVSAASIVGLAADAFERPLPPRALVFTGFVAGSSYLVDHLADACPRERAGLVRWASAGLIVMVGVVLARIWFAAPWAYAVAIGYPASVAPYAMIKRIPHAKVLYVPLVWGTLVFVPVAATNGTLSSAASVLFLIVLIQVVIAVVACDLRDAESDRQRGIVTIANHFSRARVFAALHCANIAIPLLFLVGVATGQLSHRAVVVVLQVALAGLVLRRMQQGAKWLDLLTGLVLDGAWGASVRDFTSCAVFVAR